MVVSYQLNARGSYTYTANRETVGLYDKNAVFIGAVADAKRLPQGVGEAAASRGDYVKTEVDWRLPSGQVGVEVLPGMSLIDSAGLAYVIIKADPPSISGTAWRCNCRQVRVLGFFNAVDYRPVVNTVDAYADRIADFTLFPTVGHYPARIQPASAEILDRMGKRGFLGHYVIYLLNDLNVSFGDIFVDTSNQNAVYKSVAWRGKQTLASAFEVLAEIQP